MLFWHYEKCIPTIQLIFSGLQTDDRSLCVRQIWPDDDVRIGTSLRRELTERERQRRSESEPIYGNAEEGTA
jgi:hypothetical protein